MFALISQAKYGLDKGCFPIFENSPNPRASARPLIDDDGNGCLTFEVSKGRFGFKLTAPYDEKRRKAASDLVKKNTERLRRKAL